MLRICPRTVRVPEKPWYRHDITAVIIHTALHTRLAVMHTTTNFKIKKNARCDSYKQGASPDHRTYLPMPSMHHVNRVLDEGALD